MLLVNLIDLVVDFVVLTLEKEQCLLIVPDADGKVLGLTLPLSNFVRHQADDPTPNLVQLLHDMIRFIMALIRTQLAHQLAAWVAEIFDDFSGMDQTIHDSIVFWTFAQFWTFWKLNHSVARETVHETVSHQAIGTQEGVTVDTFSDGMQGFAFAASAESSQFQRSEEVDNTIIWEKARETIAGKWCFKTAFGTDHFLVLHLEAVETERMEAGQAPGIAQRSPALPAGQADQPTTR